jgi:DNA-binding MarR family transcriptional regulator
MSNQSPHPPADPNDAFLSELPFQLAALALGFQSLLKRQGKQMGLREDVRTGMGSIFFALCEQDDCIMRDLGGRLQIPKGTLSGLLARMEKMKLVERTPCPDDGRACRVRLTAKARRMEASLRKRHAWAIEVLQAGLTTAEEKELRRLLGRVLNNLREDEAHHRTRRKRGERS